MKHRKLRSYCLILSASIFIVLFLLPLFIMLNLSFKHYNEIVVSRFRWFLFKPILGNYREVLLLGDFVRYIANSSIVAICTSFFATAFGTMAAYSISRFKIIKQEIALLILFIRMIPAVAIMLPIFLIMRNIGLTDTYPGIVIVYTAFNLPFAIWLMIGFFADLPITYEHAAIIDGCTMPQAFYRVIVPIVKGGIIATAIFCLVASWNEFPFALIITGANTRTIPVAALSYKTQVQIHWGHVMVVGSIAFIPVLAFALIFQRSLIRGMTLGGLKG